jgi:glyoxylase-like metal-dependent hydrolase (beta-lactamase superfamily II)
MNADHAVVDFPAVTVPLASRAHRLVAALRRARLVDATDGLRMRVIPSHDRLAAVSQFILIPPNGFEKTLQRPRRGTELQANSLGRLAVQIGELSFDINP